jgi:serine/threonine protein kinase
LEKINHPNIVDIIEVYEYEEAQLIVFEIMNGGEVINFLIKIYE